MRIFGKWTLIKSEKQAKREAENVAAGRHPQYLSIWDAPRDAKRPTYHVSAKASEQSCPTRDAPDIGFSAPPMVNDDGT